jgi:hypothetical protein
VVAAVAAPVSTPAEAQFMVATDFMEAVSIAVAFTAEVGEAAGMAGVGAAAAGFGARRLGRRLGLGVGSWLGDRGGGRARRDRDCVAACIRRRTRLLGQATGLDCQRPLHRPAARERLLLSLKWSRIRLQVKKN